MGNSYQHWAKRIQQEVAAIEDQLIQWRRHFHQFPELSHREEKTAAFIQTTLQSFGLEVTGSLGGHGVLGILRAQDPESRCIALRADMDALPIQEANPVGYASANPGVMHACGHDAHMANLLGVALVLSRLRTEITGTYKFIFQPAEEQMPSGAPAMIRAGVLENPVPQALLAWHVSPELPAGVIGLHSGPFMAASDELHFTITGKGGHAARYKEVNSPLPAASALVLGLVALSDPEQGQLLSVGKIDAPGATNVIPDVVKVSGTLRTFNEEQREGAHAAIRWLIKALEGKYRVQIDLPADRGYPVLINHNGLHGELAKCCEALFGNPGFQEVESRFGAEDFAYYTTHVPSYLFRLGTACGSGGLHTSRFDLDESVLRRGVELMSTFSIGYI